MMRSTASSAHRWVMQSQWVGNLLGSLLWLNLLRLQLTSAMPHLTLASALTILLTTWIIILFLTRRNPSRTGTMPELLLALGGTFVTLLLSSGGAGNLTSSALEIGGSVVGMAALLELGDSFGLAPADRGLKQRGAYAVVRHPLYASELIFFLGYFLAGPSVRSGLIIAIWWAIQVVRMLREEMIIDGYAAYARRVRWRVLPLVW